MPTAKPRVQVSLSTPQHELLRRLAKLQGRSMSSVIEELFEQVYPVLERVAVVLQAAVRAQDSMKEGLRESTAQAERELRPVMAQALGQLDLLQMEFVAAGIPPSAPPAGTAGKRPAAGTTPDVVTRGSGRGSRPPGERPRAARKGLVSRKSRKAGS